MTMGNKESGQVITFYSYKGGTGRTMALANVACLLAQQQENSDSQGILMIDWDLEAPGLHRYFRNSFVSKFGNQNNPEQAFEEHPGLIELFKGLNEQIGTEQLEGELKTLLKLFSFEDYILQTDIPNLYLLKAGCFNERYTVRVTEFNWVDLFTRTEGLLFSLLAEELANRYQYILIDSRTGITDTSNICTMLMPEKLVVVFTPNRQSFTGLKQLVEEVIQYRRGSNDLRPLVVFPLPSRIELAEGFLKEDWRFGNPNNDIPGYQPLFEELLQSIYFSSESDCKLQNYFDEVQIQQSTRFAYGEEIAVWIERSADRLSLTSSYKQFLKFLLKNVPWEQTYTEKQLVIDGISIPDTPPKNQETIEIETLSSRASNLRKSNDMLGALGTILRAVIHLKQLESSRQLEIVPRNVKQRLINRLIGICKNIREINRFEGHGDDVWDIDIHPKGELIVSASEDRTLKLWKADGTLLVNFIGHEARIRSVSFSPDCSSIASASDDRTVRLWHIDGTEIKTFLGHRDQVLSVCFSPDGQLIASASADRTIKLWKPDGTLMTNIEAHNDRIWDVRFNRQGDFIASASDDKTVKLWTLDGTLRKTFKGSEDKIYSISFSPNGQRLAAVGADKKIRIWEINEDTVPKVWQKVHEDEIFCVSFNHDGSQIATASADKTIKLWNVENEELIGTFRGHNDNVQAVLFDNNKKRLISASNDTTLRVWNLPIPNDEPLYQGHKGAVLAVAFHPTRQEIVSGSADGTVKLWTYQGELKNTFEDQQQDTEPKDILSSQRHKDAVRTICFQPILADNQRENDRLLGTGSDDGAIKLWLLTDKTPKLTLSHGGKINTVSFSPDGQIIASGGSDMTVKLWSLEGELLAIFENHQNWVLDVTFHPTKPILASGSADGTVKLWDWERYHTIDTLPAEKGDDWVNSVCFSPDGTKLAYVSDNIVRLWSLEENQLIARLTHRETVNSVCFNPDGTRILTASHDETLRLWTADGNELNSLNGHHGDAIRDAVFSPDGKMIASASDDKTVRLWNLEGDTNNPVCLPQQEEPDLSDLSEDPIFRQYLQFSCDWLDDYLKTNPNVSLSDRRLCENIRALFKI